jgi:NAD(P)-dependent dehydrogenase (short-subunit alcohol dehydrogenase family)
MGPYFVTGASSGLGYALCKNLLLQNQVVYGISRRKPDIQHLNFHYQQIDLNELDTISDRITEMLESLEAPRTVILNAGVLGHLNNMKKINVNDIQQIMTSNVWGHKVLLDHLLNYPELKQVVAVSSGAAVKSYKGWGAYSLSKATLNMLMQVYSQEFEQVHFSAIAPGLVDTAMQDYLCTQVSPDDFPSVQRLREARGTQAMPNADQAAVLFLKALTQVLQLDSGVFTDVRKLTLS